MNDVIERVRKRRSHEELEKVLSTLLAYLNCICKSWNDIYICHYFYKAIMKKHEKEYGSQPSLHGSTGFCRANSQAGFCLDPDRSHSRVD
ncbi:hypothetical protein NC651_002942 [Populus alba x Populus x berolinensis]|nr:hypothetical protein NC651_002942 [Populus alba x Populus x berolinensis]